MLEKYNMNKKEIATAEHDKVLKTLIAEIEELAKIVVEDYEENPSEMSGSITQVHENSPYLDTELESDEPLYSGSRWTKVLKSF